MENQIGFNRRLNPISRRCWKFMFDSFPFSTFSFPFYPDWQRNDKPLRFFVLSRRTSHLYDKLKRRNILTQLGIKPNPHNLGTVLLAEDDNSIRRLLEVILHRAGYNVISTEDGAAALQKALENPFDIAVLDAMMPNLNGYELCRILRQNPSFQNLPLVILSGLENEIVVDADVCLLKTPTMQEELLQVMAKLLEKRNL